MLLKALHKEQRIVYLEVPPLIHRPIPVHHTPVLEKKNVHELNIRHVAEHANVISVSGRDTLEDPDAAGGTQPTNVFAEEAEFVARAEALDTPINL